MSITAFLRDKKARTVSEVVGYFQKFALSSLSNLENYFESVVGVYEGCCVNGFKI
ncbi:MAG: hypothetical protein QXV61_02900 [Archaeoglobaceae archaeon]